MASIFKKLPMFLFSDYRELSSDAKILYSVISDRRNLSEKNGLSDENGVYVIFTLEEVDDYIPSSKGKASRIMKELRDAGLISRKRMGQGRADRIYVNIPKTAVEESYPQSSEPEYPETEPESSLCETLKLSVSAPRKTDYNYTYISIDQSVFNDKHYIPVTVTDGTDIVQKTGDKSVIEKIAKNTGIDELPDDPVNEMILDIVGEVMTGNGSETVRINGGVKPKSIVRSCFMKLDRECIKYFIYRLANHTDLKTVRNKRSYMRSMLYNSYYEHVFGNCQSAYGT